MARATEKDLILVSKSDREKLDILRAGASIVQRTGYTIEQLRQKAIKDRLNLAQILLQEASQASTASKPAYRTVVSRAYYAMYHCIRALCFFYHGGDDNEPHNKLPKAIPDDFPERARWENKLKQARLDRNRADYDPYPRALNSFKVPAQDLLQCAQELQTRTRDYLRTKGCKL
jgi:uncharacterized protein (UPF0332 family)